MRFVALSLDFGLLILALVALLHAQGTHAQSEEKCRPGNCMSSKKCEILPTKSLKCDNPKETCCSLVKTEFRTLCQHHGGECMDDCNERLIRRSNDCLKPKKCCVLVQ